MNAWKVVCATLVIFIAGIVTGAVLVRVAGARPWLRAPHELGNRPQNAVNLPNNPPLGMNPNRPNDPQAPNRSPQNPGPMSREFGLILERELRLTPEQRDQVNRIMSEGQERIRALRQGIDPDIRKEMQQAHEQIQALLTVEQRAEFQRLMKQRVQRRNEAPTQSPDRRLRDRRDPGPGEPSSRNPQGGLEF